MSTEQLENNESPWNSRFIPDWTRADTGSLALDGAPAVFRSTAHAWIALRLVYLAEVAGIDAQALAARSQLYQASWNAFVDHCARMRKLVGLLDEDPSAAVELWNAVDQVRLNTAYTGVMCEAEPWPHPTSRVNLCNFVLKHYRLSPAAPIGSVRDRKVGAKDNQAAWEAADDGRCRLCGTPTISQTQYDHAKRILGSNPGVFKLTPCYTQRNLKQALLWNTRVLPAAKGVADHVDPWSNGGATAPHNLVNSCAPCNFARSATRLDVLRVAWSTQP